MRQGLLLLLTILTTNYYVMGQEPEALFHHQGLMASEDQSRWTLSPRFHESFADHFHLENNLVTDREGKLFTGEIKVFYAADKICSIWNYKNGELDGDQFLYYQNQNLHAKYFCKNNTTEGELIHYYENGNIWFTVTMKAGELDGNVIFHYPNGNKKFEGNAKKDLSSPYHVMRDGHWIYYWENGKKKAEGILSPADDFEVRSGIWTFYDEEEKVIETKDYTNDYYIDRDSSLLGF